MLHAAPRKKCAESKYLLNSESLFLLFMEINTFVYCTHKESLFILLPSTPLTFSSSHWVEPNHKMPVYIKQMLTGKRKSMSGMQLYCDFRLNWAHLLEKQCFVSLYLSVFHNEEQVPTSSYGSPLLSFHSNVFYRCLQMNLRLNSLGFWTIRKYDMLSVWYLDIKFCLKSS